MIIKGLCPFKLDAKIVLIIYKLSLELMPADVLTWIF